VTSSILDTNFTRDNTIRALLALFAGLGSWRDPETWLNMAVPQVLAAEQLVAQTVDADLKTQLLDLLGDEAKLPIVDYAKTTGKALRGVRPDSVYRRPFQQLWTALDAGMPLEEAVQQGLHRLESIVETDLQLAATHSIFQGTKGLQRVAYRRTPKNGACALCMIASTQYYHSGTLMPIHPGCRCGVRVTLTEDESHVADPDLLERIHQAVEQTFGPDAVNRGAKDYSQYRDLVVVRSHGEYGPTLTRRGDAFEGPDH
jgi:hypothetical protein